MQIDVLTPPDVTDDETESAVEAIARHLEAALALADATGDKLLGAKLSECVEYVETFGG